MRPIAPAAIALLLLAAAAFPAAAQTDPVRVEPIRVIGTLSAVRSTTESAVPVDVIEEERLNETGATETGRAIQAAAPSFNFPSSTISDGTDALRPATLRGLGPDQTLVLVNGKRRHPSALVHVNNSVGRGTAGTDLNAIPLAAIGRVEVLRDGAAARYGSDAIAGVLNLVLKDIARGGEARATWGRTYAGDGTVHHGNVVQGLPLGSGGFLTLTADYRNRDATNRAGLTGICQYGESQDSAGNPTCDQPFRERIFDRRNFRIGDAESESRSLWLNAEMPASEGLDFYLFGGWTDRENTSGGFYRYASWIQRNPPNMDTNRLYYPDGFLPLINTDVVDLSLGLGAAFEAGDWNIDASLTHGRNTFDFYVSNSLNAYLWETEGIAVTEADSGGLGFRQTTLNIDGQTSATLFGAPAEIAVGAERRIDNYRIRDGEWTSWYGCTDDEDANACNTSSGAGGIQVLAGFRPTNALDESRNSTAVYADSELGFDRTTVGLALRGEDYDDFGSTVNGRLTARVQAAPAFAIRGSANTGFRAPSLHQKYFNNITTQFDNNEPAETGTFRNDSELARSLGIPELEEETSVNAAVGFVWTPSPALSVTFDAYQIDIKDRIMISNPVTASNLEPGCGGDPDCVKTVNDAMAGIDDAQFFLNAGNTRTKGIDIVAEHRQEFRGGNLRFTAAASWSRTRFRGGLSGPGLLGGLGENLFGARNKAFVEVAQPQGRLNLETAVTTGPWEFVVGSRTYGAYRVPETETKLQKYGGKTLFDAKVSYAISDRLTFSFGADNVFNLYPDRNKTEITRDGCIASDENGTIGDPGTCGANPIVDSEGVFQYSRRSAPFGINGGFYYARLIWNW